jgi:hypothetical protein
METSGTKSLYGTPTTFKVYSNSWLGEMFDLRDKIVCFASISNLSRYCRNFGRLDAMFNVYARTVPGTWATGNIRSVYPLYHTTVY